jgi:HEAT repeat protein
MAAKTGIAPRQVNVKALQQHLVEIGNLDKGVLDDRDSFPMPKAEVAAAVQRLAANYDGLEVALAQPRDSLPLLREAYDGASGAHKVAYAHVLGVMGDARGVETLIAEARRRLRAKDLAKPVGRKVAKNRTEMPMDDTARLLWALGGTGDRRVVPTLCALAEATAGVEFATSARFRAIAVSLGRLGDPAAAPALATMMTSKAGKDEVSELIAACALFRCGDKEGLARAALDRFVAGSSGPFSRLAWQVLRANR